MRGTPLESYSTDAGVGHARDRTRPRWKRLEQQQLSKIRAWAPQALGPAYQETGPMYYMFSGPDFLYANAFFPNASTYILCGIEPVGPVPDIDKIPRAVLPSALANLRKSLDSVLSWSFFITKNMKVDLKQTAAQRHPAGPLRFPRARRLHHRFRHAGRARSHRQFCSRRQRHDSRREDRLYRTERAAANALLFHAPTWRIGPSR